MAPPMAVPPIRPAQVLCEPKRLRAIGLFIFFVNFGTSVANMFAKYAGARKISVLSIIASIDIVYFISRGLIPGSGLPSRNSIMAPPPVEMWL